MFGLKSDWSLDVPARYFTLEDYEGGTARWCPGCGDLAVLTAVQRICREEQLPPEKVVSVSGIGCSSRFPHYMGTYGFHGLHGRALPVACGVKARRPDLTVWVATGDGDCCSIGAGHWVHATRYNMDMTVMLFDNNVYGLTKNQTSPTSPVGLKTNTHPRGAWLPPLNPLSATLGFTNASFVAQTIDWNPPHLYETLKAAHHHKGFSFVRILQRCPTYTDHVFEELQRDPSQLVVLNHDEGVSLEPSVGKMFPNHERHDPSNLDEARRQAGREDLIPIGVLFRNEACPRYDEYTAQGLDMTMDERIAGLNRELDRFAI
ncbi:MAG: thiamine pyrophosphate-dependent enzyme [Candidatus Eisenbacteria bacterium]|uniref:2-oxoglutarate oxidoreductase n=1 Tax=Eiseniibacteriota bacterium TaxID=2212470 RepID=A0A956RN23_UNCEI|nr:2-oxoglutarate oxidoreductase [Candidatus Eisenbacteria bacterium]